MNVGSTKWILACMGLLLLMGCNNPRMKQFDVTVSLDQTLRENPPTLRVDLVGIGSGDGAIRQMPVDDYFADEDLREDLERSGKRRTFTFLDGQIEPQTLSRRDGIWDAWKRDNLMELMIVAEFLQGTNSDDARRLIIPLSSDRWERSQNQLEITIQRSRLQLSPQFQQ